MVWIPFRGLRCESRDAFHPGQVPLLQNVRVLPLLTFLRDLRGRRDTATAPSSIWMVLQCVPPTSLRVRTTIGMAARPIARRSTSSAFSSPLSRAFLLSPPSGAEEGRCGPSRRVPSRCARSLRASGDATTLVFVGSSGAVPAPTSRSPEVSLVPEGACSACRAASSLPTPLCVRSVRPVPMSSASPRGIAAVRLDFLSWGCQRSLSVPSVPPLKAVESVAGLFRGSRVAPLDARGRPSRLPVPGPCMVSHPAARGCSPLHRHERHAAARSVRRWPPPSRAVGSPPRPWSGTCAVRRPGAADANLLAPAFRPRRFARPRRCHCTLPACPRHAPGAPVRCVSATSRCAGCACAPRALPLMRQRFWQTSPRPLSWSGPKACHEMRTADHGVHRVSGTAAASAAPLGAAHSGERFHSLDALLPLGAFTPCGRRCSPERPTFRVRQLQFPVAPSRGRLPSEHASTCPSRRCLAVMDSSRLARHHAFASRGPLGHPCPDSAVRVVLTTRPAAPASRASLLGHQLVSTSRYFRRQRTGPRSALHPKMVRTVASGLLPGLVLSAWPGPFTSSVSATRAPALPRGLSSGGAGPCFQGHPRLGCVVLAGRPLAALGGRGFDSRPAARGRRSVQDPANSR